MDSVNIRNFRDFMLLYNVTTENCFNKCVNNFNSRKLANDELSCAETCAGKQINLLNKIMSCYLDAQSEIMTRRIAEAQQTQAADASAATLVATESTGNLAK